jgi:hypothetical protein
VWSINPSSTLVSVTRALKLLTVLDEESGIEQVLGEMLVLIVPGSLPESSANRSWPRLGPENRHRVWDLWTRELDSVSELIRSAGMQTLN